MSLSPRLPQLFQSKKSPSKKDLKNQNSILNEANSFAIIILHFRIPHLGAIFVFFSFDETLMKLFQ